jgi:hypothetical protein
MDCICLNIGWVDHDVRESRSGSPPMRSITERLALRAATGTPVVFFSFLQVHRHWFAFCNDRFTLFQPYSSNQFWISDDLDQRGTFVRDGFAQRRLQLLRLSNPYAKPPAVVGKIGKRRIVQ